MQEQIIFAEGVYFNQPSEKTADFMFGKLSIKKDKLINWLQNQPDNQSGYLNLDIMKSKRGGSPYIKLNTYQKPVDSQSTPMADEIPF